MAMLPSSLSFPKTKKKIFYFIMDQAVGDLNRFEPTLLIDIMKNECKCSRMNFETLGCFDPLCFGLFNLREMKTSNMLSNIMCENQKDFLLQVPLQSLPLLLVKNSFFRPFLD